jgi:hypothetical protein
MPTGKPERVRLDDDELHAYDLAWTEWRDARSRRFTVWEAFNAGWRAASEWHRSQTDE